MFVLSQETGHYTERDEQFFKANEIVVEKKGTILLSGMNVKSYSSLTSLQASQQPSQFTFAELV